MTKEVNKFHALQLFTDTFSAETVHLTNEAIGIYIRLICFNWTKNTKPFTTESAYRICQCRLDECRDMVDLVLNEFFILGKDKNTWTHKRLTAEHEYLTSKYKNKSDSGKKGAKSRWNKSANGETMAPSPIPSPIPNNNINKTKNVKEDKEKPFNIFWSNITTKKGSKHRSMKLYESLCATLDPIETANRFNRMCSDVKDKQFVPYVATWLNQRRFEDEDNNIPNINDIINRLIKLGYKHCGSEGTFEKFSKKGKNYKINSRDKDYMILDD
jgi:uncharacterized protein YdaU (DUF1376 family)